MGYPSQIWGWKRGVAPVAALLFASAPAAGAAKGDVGLVLRVQGKPIGTDSVGQWRPTEVLQNIRDGETVIFDAGDALVFCSQGRGTAFEVEGPGTVSVGQAGVTVLAGSPRVTQAGPCDGDAAADSNGGVILRHMVPHSPPPAAPGKE